MPLLKILALTLAILAPTTALADWSGLYIGGSLSSVPSANLTTGSGAAETSYVIDDHSPVGGFIGYQVQSSRVIFGGEYALMAATDVTASGIPNEYAAAYGNLKARVGYTFGQVMVYGVAGTSAIAFDAGFFSDALGTGYGYGADYAASPNIVIGAEYFSSSTTGEATDLGAILDAQIDVDTFSVRASFIF
jgi:opacity protein-like surface antigen